MLENLFSSTRIYFMITVTTQFDRLAQDLRGHINSFLSAKTLFVLPSDEMGDKKKKSLYIYIYMYINILHLYNIQSETNKLHYSFNLFYTLNQILISFVIF